MKNLLIIFLAAWLLPFSVNAKNITENYTLNSNESFLTSVRLEAALDLNGHNLVIDGDLVIGDEGVFTSHGGSLEVKGSIYFEAGYDDPVFHVQDGYILVHQDFRLQRLSGDPDAPWKTTYVDFAMTHENGMLEVLGDFHTANSNSYQKITAGVIVLHNSFYQTSDIYGRWGFTASGTHQVILRGSNARELHFQDAQSHFNILTFDTPSLIDIDWGPGFQGNHIQNTGAGIKTIETGDRHWELTENVVIDGDLIHNGGRRIELGGHSMSIGGELIVSNGSIEVQQGQLEVAGETHLQTPAEDGNWYFRGGEINMTHADGYALFHKHFHVSGNSSFIGNKLTAGIMEFKSHISQRSYEDDPAWARGAFDSKDDHVIVLSGTQEQILSFDDDHYSQIKHLRVLNGRERPINFLQNLNVYNFEADYLWLKQITIRREADIDFSLPSDTYIEGDFRSEGASTYLNGHSLIVTGWYWQQNGVLDFNRGAMQVGLHFRFVNIDDDTESGSSYLNMIYPEDYLLVEGDFELHSSGDSTLMNGTVEVKGDFIVNPTGSYVDLYAPTDNHKTILSGDGEQRVYIADSWENRLHNLVIANFSGLVEFIGDIVFSGEQTVRLRLDITGEVTSSVALYVNGQAFSECSGESCLYDFSAGDAVELHAQPASGFGIKSWQGVETCRGGNRCRLSMNNAMHITAEFGQRSVQNDGINIIFLLEAQ